MLEYTLSPLNLSEHIFHVRLRADIQSMNKVKLSLPAWIPGSYMIRDFAKSIVSIEVQEGSASLRKIDKQSWYLESADSSAIGKVLIEYTIFAFDLSVRSAYINDEYAFCNGTSVFLSVEELQGSTHQVIVNASDTMPWAHIITSMPLKIPSKTTDNERVFQTDNYHQLIDHPILIGRVTQQSFQVKNTQFHVVFTGEHDFDMQRICDDLKPICQHHIDLFGAMPEPEYYFITLVCKDGFGGLEHRSSTVLQYTRDGIPLRGESVNEKSELYREFLALCSHELFHLWHVKRNRPEALISPDLTQEVYTSQLWIYEGFTSFYDDLALARTGVISPNEYTSVLGTAITRLLRNPGRHIQSIAESSFYAWNKFYKQTASSTNHIVSYYLKGSIVALALDVRLRQLSNEKYCLDDVLRIIFQEYGSLEKGTPDDVISQICRNHLDLDIDSFLDISVAGTMDLPLPQIFQHIGLKLNLRGRLDFDDKGGKSALNNTITNDFGATVKDVTVGCAVLQVLSDSAASIAGLQIDDLIISVDRLETNKQHLARHIKRRNIGDTCTLHVLRDGRLLKLSLTLQAAPTDTCFITVEDELRYHQWLGIPTNNMHGL